MNHYDYLTKAERDFIDSVFDARTLYELAIRHGVPPPDDTAAVEAMAKTLIENRMEKAA